MISPRLLLVEDRTTEFKSEEGETYRMHVVAQRLHGSKMHVDYVSLDSWNDRKDMDALLGKEDYSAVLLPETFAEEVEDVKVIGYGGENGRSTFEFYVELEPSLEGFIDKLRKVL